VVRVFLAISLFLLPAAAFAENQHSPLIERALAALFLRIREHIEERQQPPTPWATGTEPYHLPLTSRDKKIPNPIDKAINCNEH